MVRLMLDGMKSEIMSRAAVTSVVLAIVAAPAVHA